ncbi:MAG TPA: diguanylate cyclase [Bryobacteraceae bacterium]|nr:diguanylate cyclase [Bryobacteraceae bacterium]
MRERATIAAIAPSQPEDFFDLLWQGIWESTFDLSSFGVEVQNLTTESDGLGEQRKILELLLDSPPDAIALMPMHVCAVDDLIDEHVRRGTPVITFLSDAPASRRSACIHPDPRQAGVLAGELLSKLVAGRGRILCFPGATDQFHLVERYAGFREALARHHAGSISEICSRTPSEDSANAVREMLEGDQPLAGCYVGDNRLVAVARGLERLSQELGLRTPCIGFGNTTQILPLLTSGAVSAVIDENRYQIGYFAVQKAYEAILKRERGRISSVQIPSSVIFAANAPRQEDSLGSAFELLIRQRTESLISYKKRLEEANVKLEALAVTDPLTGLFNRRKFEETLGQETARALRYGPVSLLIIDLNYFKLVNDQHGHQAGDDALKTVAQVLQSCCRTTDTCARLGGDEFGVILPHSDPTAAAVVLDRIQHQIAQTAVPTGTGALKISLSIGSATLPNDVTTAEDLIAAADAAMYQAKQASRSHPRLEPAPVAKS